MQFVTLILVFVIIWWMIFFTMLPIGVKNHEESGEKIVEGSEGGAPVKPNLKRKALITTMIALVLTVGFYFLEASDLISLRGQG